MRRPGRGSAAILLAIAGLALPAAAADGDAEYCQKLGQLALRYTGSAGGEGRLAADHVTLSGIEDCRRGNYAAGIAALERKLRSNGFTLPSR
jgi:hypothetical protein